MCTRVCVNDKCVKCVLIYVFTYVIPAGVKGTELIILWLKYTTKVNAEISECAFAIHLWMKDDRGDVEVNALVLVMERTQRMHVRLLRCAWGRLH